MRLVGQVGQVEPLVEEDHLDAHAGGDVGQAELRDLAAARPWVAEQHRPARVNVLRGAQPVELAQVGRERGAGGQGRHGQRHAGRHDPRDRAVEPSDRLHDGHADRRGAGDQAREPDRPAWQTFGEQPPDARHRGRQAGEGDDEPHDVARDEDDHLDDERGGRQQREDSEQAAAQRWGCRERRSSCAESTPFGRREAPLDGRAETMTRVYGTSLCGARSGGNGATAFAEFDVRRAAECLIPSRRGFSLVSAVSCTTRRTARAARRVQSRPALDSTDRWRATWIPPNHRPARQSRPIDR